MVVEPPTTRACHTCGIIERLIEGLFVLFGPRILAVRERGEKSVFKTPHAVNEDDCRQSWLESGGSCGEVSSQTHTNEADLARVDVCQLVFVLCEDVIDDWCYDLLPIWNPAFLLFVDQPKLSGAFEDNDVIIPLQGSEAKVVQHLLHVGIEASVHDYRWSWIGSRCDSCAVYDGGHAEAMVRLNADMLTWNRPVGIGDVEPLPPQLIVLVESWIRLVAMKEEVRHELVVAGSKVDIPDSDRRVRFELGLVDRCEDSLG